MKTYTGKYEDGQCVVRVWERTKCRKLDNWRGEASAGFGWGHSGEEAQDLAYSLCVDVTLSRDEAERCYDVVLEQIIKPIRPRSAWYINEDQIVQAIRDAYMQPVFRGL